MASLLEWFASGHESSEYLERVFSVALTQRQLEIINGSLLGDACLEKVSTNKENSRFIEKHGIEQRDYLNWKRRVV